MSNATVTKSNTLSISIVVTCYNLEKYIELTLKSIFKQDYQGPMELIIVNDASTDNSLNIIYSTIEKYGDGWDIRVIAKETNGGIAAAMDTCFSAAKYDWIVEVDGDDIQMPNRCSKLAEIVNKNPTLTLVNMSYEKIDADGNSYGFYNNIIPRDGGELKKSYEFSTPDERLKLYFHDAHVAHENAFGCSMNFNRNLFLKWGCLLTPEYNGGRFAQDTPWELRAILSGPVLWSLEAACQYRSHESNIYNRSRKWETVTDWMNLELDNCKYAAIHALALEQRLRDIERAKTDQELTDFNLQALKKIEEDLKQHIFISNLRPKWWSSSYFKRIYWAIKYKNKVPREFNTWMLYRLLPLRLASYLRRRKLTSN